MVRWLVEVSDDVCHIRIRPRNHSEMVRWLVEDAGAALDVPLAYHPPIDGLPAAHDVTAREVGSAPNEARRSRRGSVLTMMTTTMMHGLDHEGADATSGDGRSSTLKILTKMTTTMMQGLDHDATNGDGRSSTISPPNARSRSGCGCAPPCTPRLGMTCHIRIRPLNH